MKRTFRTMTGKRVEMRPEDIRKERLYLIGVHAVTVVGFLVCVIAGGFI